jgi:hypothetical protein|tara:strand:- start:338 stop:553 length:216 start_codon:yes stop_codon:yes gene_type:complete
MVLLSSCNPLFGVGSFVHSVITGNTVGIVTGGAGIAVEESTGKSITEHILTPRKKKEKPVMGKKIEWVYID